MPPSGCRPRRKHGSGFQAVVTNCLPMARQGYWHHFQDGWDDTRFPPLEGRAVPSMARSFCRRANRPGKMELTSGPTGDLEPRLTAALQGVVMRGKARAPGDKTMVDALTPSRRCPQDDHRRRTLARRCPGLGRCRPTGHGGNDPLVARKGRARAIWASEAPVTKIRERLLVLILECAAIAGKASTSKSAAWA